MNLESIPKINTTQLAQILGFKEVEILNRESILEHKEKIIERIDWKRPSSNHIQTMFIKYGKGLYFARELFFYDALSTPVKDQIPELITCQTNPDLLVLVIEWIDGYNPDFKDKAVVKQTFKNLGIWAAHWEKPIQNYMNGDKNALTIKNSHYGEWSTDDLLNGLNAKDKIYWIFTDTAASVKNNQDIVMDLGGKHLVKFFQKLNSDLRQYLIDKIYSVPLTLHPGDVSKYNTLVRKSSKQIYFVDFEGIKICPMSVLMEFIGESWESVPQGSLATVALESYFNAWNKYSSTTPITWNTFIDSYISTRILHKCYLIKWWISKNGSVNPENRTPEKEWVKQHALDLLDLIKKLEKQ
ncbi:hypothetical protein [Bacillus taeanensis]|uniref:Aminoglycoside phosphotransferase domain-containing protein n=1 Tax=Bacillus taeanensis TaxID=273032 RepID=A0A366XXT3_9BACI|nr:hypothetical protein [Bacillus taeanensis]RBW69955.1 hypothetical protein DS031_08865 [Bacillus taeanensis]